MRISPGFLSLITMIVFIVHGVAATSLREQLEAATAHEDSYAQIDLIRRLLDEAPDDDLNQQLVSLWIRVGDYGMAERTLDDWKSAPAGFRAIAEADILLARDRNREKALAKLESYHFRDPADAEVTFRLVGVLSGQNDNQRIDEVLTTAPGVESDADLLLRRARARRSLAKFSQALKDFAAADQIDPEVVANDRPAFERLREGLPEIDEVTGKLVQNPNDFELRVDRARLYRDGGAGGDQVAVDAKAALAIDPRSVAATLLDVAASQSQDTALKEYSVDLSKEAPSAQDLKRLATLDIRLAANPRDAGALADRSAVLNENGQFRLALRDAEAAVEIDRSQGPAHLERIYALTQMGSNILATEALAAMKRTKASRANLAQASGYLAVAELEANRYAAALEFASQSIDSAPSAERYRTRATILERMGQSAEAREDLQRAKALTKKS